MNWLMIAILIACLQTPVLPTPARAEVATMDEALTVATNWIVLTLRQKRNWGGAETAEVEEIQEFKRGDRIIGYFCRVQPQGFIVVSLYKHLGPVKAYSETTDLDPESEEGLADLIKGLMERVLDSVERLVGPVEAAKARDLNRILEIDYRQSWAQLEGDVESFKRKLESGTVEMNYQEGDVLLSSNWHQMEPYNEQCPAPPGGDDCTSAHCTVGCVPLAGAQVMRYWNWPPYRGNPSDTYDWPHMANEYLSDGAGGWKDGKGNPLTQVHVDAVAELCHEVGIEAGADYCDGAGCATSACFASCLGADLLDAFEDHFRYSGAADNRDRNDYSAVGWFNLIKAELNLNRPLPYRVINHAIVCDGWKEVGSTPDRYYHMNYGWAGNSDDTWYLLDALYLGGVDEEKLIESLFPAQALGAVLSGTYPRQSFPYRYFDRDAVGSSATFSAGQFLQFLPNVEVTGTGTTSSIGFYGSSSDSTRLYTRGDTSKGIHIRDGAVKLTNNGSLRFP